MFTFITLLLNGLLAGALTPLVTGSVAQLASAALALGLGGLLVWGLHLRVDGRQPQT
jgi:DHA1 family bicyclomycin/chloramphenicol resistance-like MFS transporter